jgi:hypothetical protein
MEARPLDSEKPDSRAAPLVARGSRLMRDVNSNIRRLSGTFALSEPMLLFCECRGPTCFSRVPTSAEAFDATVAEEKGWILLEGHEPSAP